MQAIEFETTAKNHVIRLPDSVPDGVNLRVLVLLDETVVESKTFLADEYLEPPNPSAPLTAKSAFGLVKTSITATLADIEQGIIAGAISDND